MCVCVRACVCVLVYVSAKEVERKKAGKGN